MERKSGKSMLTARHDDDDFSLHRVRTKLMKGIFTGQQTVVVPYVAVYIYIYIYREREREREIDNKAIQVKGEI